MYLIGGFIETIYLGKEKKESSEISWISIVYQTSKSGTGLDIKIFQETDAEVEGNAEG